MTQPSSIAARRSVFVCNGCPTFHFGGSGGVASQSDSSNVARLVTMKHPRWRQVIILNLHQNTGNVLIPGVFLRYGGGIGGGAQGFLRNTTVTGVLSIPG